MFGNQGSFPNDIMLFLSIHYSLPPPLCCVVYASFIFVGHADPMIFMECSLKNIPFCHIKDIRTTRTQIKHVHVYEACCGKAVLQLTVIFFVASDINL